jgi:putative nucleotidyltransferase with HDIG domain
MKDFLNRIYRNHALIYKSVLFFSVTFLIVFLLPKGSFFKYDLQKGKVWQYNDLYAPFDFAIQKSEEDLQKEKDQIINTKDLYFKVIKGVEEQQIQEFKDQLELKFQDLTIKQKESILKTGEKIIREIYQRGVSDHPVNPKQKIILIDKNKANFTSAHKLITYNNIDQFLNKSLKDVNLNISGTISPIIKKTLKPNLEFNKEFTEKALQEKLNKISFTKGKISKGELLISKGNILDDSKYKILNSLKNEHKNQQLSNSNFYWALLGYTLLVALTLMMLFLFLKKYRPDIYENNNKVFFILFNVLLMVIMVTFIIRLKPEFLYATPLIILPIIIKTFFDARLGLFIHVLTVLLLGFVVSNSFEFIFLQIIAGIVTILTISNLYKRATLFISITQITLVYMIAYFAFHIIQEGTAQNIKLIYFVLFLLNGLLALLAQYLIWIYEKVFGLVSDVSLLELSNTNSKLLRELNEKAPGTFQHSMQVANIAETSANEIGANAMLVRTGALYHDIGKILNPMFFTENQSVNVNIHNELSPKDSARVIINHVIKGVELAKKHGLPDRIIDFIRTHHGTNLVYYFYKKQEELTPDSVNKNYFRYPGPIPFSKETAILMMCDASEAASKSLKEPTAQSIDELIDKVIDSQMQAGQFMNSDITFKEIQIIKKVIKKKLKNIYHLRVEYPE